MPNEASGVTLSLALPELPMTRSKNLCRVSKPFSLAAELEARGVAFVSLKDNVDLSTRSGRLMNFRFLLSRLEIRLLNL
jgi:DNA invertase Pin-like site-specific DNA recombinase